MRTLGQDVQHKQRRQALAGPVAAAAQLVKGAHELRGSWRRALWPRHGPPRYVGKQTDRLTFAGLQPTDAALAQHESGLRTAQAAVLRAFGV